MTKLFELSNYATTTKHREIMRKIPHICPELNPKPSVQIAFAYCFLMVYTDHNKVLWQYFPLHGTCIVTVQTRIVCGFGITLNCMIEESFSGLVPSHKAGISLSAELLQAILTRLETRQALDNLLHASVPLPHSSRNLHCTWKLKEMKALPQDCTLQEQNERRIRWEQLTISVVN